MATILGTATDETIIGTAEEDIIDGGAGKDIIRSGNGNDVVNGGDGNDAINGEAGNDTLFGDAGNDTLTGDAGNDLIYGGEGTDGVFGGGNDDTIYGENGTDTLYGDGGSDRIYGGADNDKLYGGTGDDLLDGGTGNDILDGGVGNDTLVVRVGEGVDTLLGGAGVDSLKLDLVTADLTPALLADLAAFSAWLAQNLSNAGGNVAALAALTTASPFTFTSFNLTVSAIEGVQVTVDGLSVSLESLLNSAPVADPNVSVAGVEDVPLFGTIVAADVNGDVLSFSVDQSPANGTLALDAATGAYTYTPETDFNGSDSFSVRVADLSGAFVTQTVTVGVAAVNDAPAAVASVALATQEDTAISGQVVASDIEGDVLSFALDQGPANGTLTLDAATGAYTYTPAVNFNGTDSFGVRVADPSGSFVMQTVTVGVAAVNDAPEAAATTTLATQEDTAIFGQVVAADVDGDVLSFAVNQGPTSGALTLDATTGHYTYTPGANYSGSDGFVVRVVDPSGAFATQTVTVGIAAVADIPMLTVQNVIGPAPVASDSDMVLVGSSRDDNLTGGLGDDIILGSSGNDVLTGDGPKVVTVALQIDAALVDLDGSETLSILIGGMPAGASLSAGINNGNGTWSVAKVQLNGLTLTASNASDFNLLVTATSQEATGSTAVASSTFSVSFDRSTGGDDQLNGGSGNDSLYGNAGNDTLTGGSGNDQLWGGLGNDTLNGDANDDRLYCDAGNDKMNGGNGFDTLDFSAATASVIVDVAKGTAVGMGSDTFSSIERIVGSEFADTFIGSSNANSFDGGAGNDTFRGMAGADIFTGAAGSDTYNWLVSDVGSSSNHDHITDFSVGDRLDLRDFTKGLAGAPITNAVRIADGTDGTMVSVKIGSSFVDLVELDGVHGVTVGSLLADGMILA